MPRDPAPFSLRPARPEDGPAVAAIWNPIIRDTEITFTTEERTPEGLARSFAEKAAADHPFLLACAPDGTCLGFATYGQFRAGPGYARSMEHTIILGPDGRGRGVGRALMAALEAHAAARAVHLLIGGISAGNASGLGFHAALGFVEIARLREVGWKNGRFHDLVLMAKTPAPGPLVHDSKAPLG